MNSPELLKKSGFTYLNITKAIYLLGPAGSSRTNDKKRYKKEIQAKERRNEKGSVETQRAELPTPTQAIDAFIRRKEKNGK